MVSLRILILCVIMALCSWNSWILHHLCFYGVRNCLPRHCRVNRL